VEASDRRNKEHYHTYAIHSEQVTWKSENTSTVCTFSYLTPNLYIGDTSSVKSSCCRAIHKWVK